MTREDWRRLVEEQKRSGQTIASFCNERGINRVSFSVNKSLIKKEKQGTFVAIGNRKPVEVVLSSGTIIRCDTSELPSVLKAIHA